jgi:hypothetical protein
MKKLHRAIAYTSVILAGVFFLSGCLGSGNNQYSSSAQFGVRVDAGQNPYDFDSTLVSGNDSLTVQRFRFVFGGDSLVVNDSTLAVIGKKSKWTSFSVPNTRGLNPVVLFPSRITGTYHKFIFSVQQAPKNATNIDPEFTSNGHHYSLIIQGKYNGENFTYRSNKSFVKSFSLGPVDLPQYNARYAFIITTDVSTWFSKNPGGGGGFYNPRDANSSSKLDSLFSKRIKNSLQLEKHSNQPGGVQ